MDINDFLEIWENENTNEEAVEIFWDNRAEEFNKNEKGISNLIDFLLSNRMISEDGNKLN